MSNHLVLLSCLLVTSLPVQARAEQQTLLGNWVSRGQQETRTLTLNDNGKGQFLSEHTLGQCLAPLDTVIDGGYVMAAGLAKNCQQKDNAVAFELYCQQTTVNQLRCKIHSKHQLSDNIIQGVEDFQRISR